MTTRAFRLVAMLMVCACCGCGASYAAPGRGADLTAVGAPSAEQYGPGTDSTIRQAFDKLLMDTRNGYLYGLSEATAQQNRFTNSWQNEVAIDETRRATETEAFGKLVGELETTWRNVVATHADAPEVARQAE